MSDLLASNVTIIESWFNGSVSGKRNVVRRVKWTETTAGGGTNRLLASAMKFNKILNCSPVLLDALSKGVVAAVPSADGSEILTSDGATGVADLATSSAFAYCTVEGIPSGP